ncbi:hypothetical protein [Calothrix sp. NIES-2100]
MNAMRIADSEVSRCQFIKKGCQSIDNLSTFPNRTFSISLKAIAA